MFRIYPPFAGKQDDSRQVQSCLTRSFYVVLLHLCLCCIFCSVFFCILFRFIWQPQTHTLSLPTYLLYLLLRNTHLINAPLIDSTTYLAHCISFLLSSSALERHHITYSAAYKSKRGVLNVMETVPDKNHHPITRPSYLIDRGVSAK